MRQMLFTLLMTLLGCLIVASATAEDSAAKSYEINIRSQKLGAALGALATQTDSQLAFSYDLVQDLDSNAVSGTYTLVDVLAIMLDGTGLSGNLTASGVIVVTRLPAKGDIDGIGEETMSTDNKKSGLLQRIAAAATLVFGSTAIATAAQDGVIEGGGDAYRVLEEIVVTAERRAENLYRIPIAISAYSGETMKEAGVKGLLDLNQLSPSIQIGQQDVNTFVSIRGIGAELINIGGESGVTITQDGIPLVNQILFDANFFDVERVELLRGPQGTISGRNATGGAINIHSNQPTPAFESGVRVSSGNYNHLGFEGYVSGPIAGERLMGRLAVLTENADGWLTNTFRNTDLNDVDRHQVRLSLLADISEDLEAQLVLEALRDRSAPVSTLDLGRARADQPGYAESFGVAAFDADRLEFQADHPNERSIDRYSSVLTLAWTMGTAATLTSTTGHISFDRAAKDDFDATTIAGSSFDCTCIDLWQASQEFTLTADLSDQLDIIVGALYMKSEAKEPLVFGLPIFGLPLGSIELRADQSLTSYALYSQMRYWLRDDVRVSFGARYTTDKKAYVEADAFFGFPVPVKSDNETWRAFTPRLAIDYTPTDDLTVYASVSRGFKAGGFNTFSDVIDEFSPEYVWNYEAGFKASWLDKRVRATFAVFYMDYTDLQQSLFILDPISGLSLPNVINAADAGISGLEMDLAWLITDRLKVTFAGAWLDATYDSLRSNDVLFPELGDRDLAGNRLVRAPKWQSNLSGQYRIGLGSRWHAMVRLDYAWQDDVYFDFFNHDALVQGAHGVLNATASIESVDARWRFSLFARNAFDERYLNHLRVVDGTPRSLSGTVGAPRMYGASVAYQH